MWHGQSIAIIIPAFNESRAIRRTICRVPDWVDHIVVVDDSSTDDTWDTLQAMTERRFVSVRHGRNRGVGASIVTGYQQAMALGSDVLVVMAGDDQMDPNDLPTLLECLRNSDAVYAKGNRLIHPQWAMMPRSRRWGSRALSVLTRWTSGLDVGDCQCGYTALLSTAASKLPLSELWPRYGYPNDLLLLLARSGFSVVEAPVRPVYADEKSGLHAGHVISIAYRILRRWSGMSLRVQRWPELNTSKSTGSSRVGE